MILNVGFGEFIGLLWNVCVSTCRVSLARDHA